jgi:CRISPR/Cas system-associated exonuclease Cas4 (RecB family)
LNRDTLALHHEVVPFDAREAQRLSDRAIEIILGAEAGDLPPRVAANVNCYLCRFCPYAERCWREDA